MNELNINQLGVGNIVGFKLNHWAKSNIHTVKILFVGDMYIVMLNLQRNEEHCVRVDLSSDRKPLFFNLES